VGLVAKDYPLFRQDLKKLEKILSKYSVEILLEKNCAKRIEKNGFELIKLAKECEFLITLGGDGTIISTCRKLAHISPLVLGIHAGRLGFLTDITINESEKFFKDFFDGKFEVETPFMLDVTLHKNDGKTEQKIAFNDAVIVSKNGGSMADAGSVMFQFDRKGVIRVAASGEEALLRVLDAGAEDAIEADGELIVYTGMKDLASVRKALLDAGMNVKEAELQYVAKNDVLISDVETARKVMKIVDALDDLDDVVNVHTNADITVDVDD